MTFYFTILIFSPSILSLSQNQNCEGKKIWIVSYKLKIARKTVRIEEIKCHNYFLNILLSGWNKLPYTCKYTSYFAVCMWPFFLLFYSDSLYLPFSEFLSACLSCFCVFVFLSAVLRYGMRSGHALEMMVPQRPAVNIPLSHTHHSTCRHLGHKHIVPSCIKCYPSVIFLCLCVRGAVRV